MLEKDPSTFQLSDNNNPIEIKNFQQSQNIQDGQILNNLSNLPPEAQEKIQAALGKVNNNPGFMNLLSSMGELIKAGRIISTMPISETVKAEQIRQILTHFKNQPNRKIEISSTDILTPTPSNNAPQPLNPVSKLHLGDYAALNRQRNSTPTFNPHVQGDSTRRLIFLLATAAIIGYLIYTFALHSQLPF